MSGEDGVGAVAERAFARRWQGHMGIFIRDVLEIHHGGAGICSTLARTYGDIHRGCIGNSSRRSRHWLKANAHRPRDERSMTLRTATSCSRQTPKLCTTGCAAVANSLHEGTAQCARCPGSKALSRVVGGTRGGGWASPVARAVADAVAGTVAGAVAAAVAGDVGAAAARATAVCLAWCET